MPLSQPRQPTKATNTSYLPREDVAVPAQLQCVTILLLPWVTPYELEVHLFPIQLSLVR